MVPRLGRFNLIDSVKLLTESGAQTLIDTIKRGSNAYLPLAILSVPAQALAADDSLYTGASAKLIGPSNPFSQLITANLQLLETINGQVHCFGISLVLYTLLIKGVTSVPNLLLQKMGDDAWAERLKEMTEMSIRKEENGKLLSEALEDK